MGRALGITLGIVRGSSPKRPYILSPRDLEAHQLVLGVSGSGKSYFLLSEILQLVSSGRAFGLLDPHGDLALGVLEHLVARGLYRESVAWFDRLVYLEFTAESVPPFNVLAAARDPHARANQVLDALIRVWPEVDQAPLLRTIFLASAVTLAVNGRPLADLSRLLTDEDFRARLVSRVEDELIRDAWEHFEASNGSAWQAGSTLRRAFQLGFHPVARSSLGARDNVLRFREWMDEGRSFLIDLGPVPDPLTRKLLAALLMVEIEQAAKSRGELPPSHRKPFHLFIDEWPVVAAKNPELLSAFLDETRKHRTFLVAAGQRVDQLSRGQLLGAMGNAGVRVLFRLGPDCAKKVGRWVGEIAEPGLDETLGAWDTFRTRPAEDVPKPKPAVVLTSLADREAIVRVRGAEARRIRTLDVRDHHEPDDGLYEVLSAYRERYLVPVSPTETPRSGSGQDGEAFVIVEDNDELLTADGRPIFGERAIAAARAAQRRGA